MALLEGYRLTPLQLDSFQPPSSAVGHRRRRQKGSEEDSHDGFGSSGDRHSSNSRNSGEEAASWSYSVPVLSTFLGFVQVLLYFWSDRAGIKTEEDIGVSWTKVSQDGGFWRLIFAHYFHFGRLHVILNVISLYCFGRFLERKMQWFALLVILEAMGIGSNVLFILTNRFVAGGAADPIACGFSHVHYGLRILLAYIQEPRNYEPSLFLGMFPAYLSPIWAPWQPVLEVSLLKLIIPELNVVGHFSGIVMGFLISFVLKIVPPRLIYTQQFVHARNWRRG